MSWWRTGHNDDVIGDVPADRVAEALDAIGAACARRGAAPPTLAALLDAAVAALRLGAERLFPELSGNAIRRLVAHLSDGATIEGGGPRPAEGELVAPLMRAFERAAATYQDVIGRAPRPSELAACLAFVVDARPGDHADTDGLTVERLELLVEPADAGEGGASGAPGGGG